MLLSPTNNYLIYFRPNSIVYVNIITWNTLPKHNNNRLSQRFGLNGLSAEMRRAASGDNNSQMLGEMGGGVCVCDRPYVRSGQHVDLFPVLKYNISTPIVKKRGPEPFPSSATIGEVKYNNIQYRERWAREVIFFSFSLSQSIDVEDIIIRSASLGYCICLHTVYISL